MSRHDRALYLIVTRLIEIIGEAARRVSATTREAHADIPWSQIIGTRDRIAHGYDRISMDILWSVVSTDLPKLVASLDRILKHS